MATNNPTGYYPDFIIKDISASNAQNPTTNGLPPMLFSIDGPLSLKGASAPYTVTVSKIKDR